MRAKAQDGVTFWPPSSQGGRAKTVGRTLCALSLLFTLALSGCAEIPISGLIRTQTAFRGDAHFDGRVSASMETPIRVEIPPAIDPGPMVAVPVRAGQPGARVGIVDVDGLILNQNVTGLYSVGENPVAAFREKLEAAAADPSVRAVVVRINSPGGSVTASRHHGRGAAAVPRVDGQAGRGLPDGPGHRGRLLRGRRRPTAWSPTRRPSPGASGALINHYNLQDAAAQLNARSGP